MKTMWIWVLYVVFVHVAVRLIKPLKLYYDHCKGVTEKMKEKLLKKVQFKPNIILEDIKRIRNFSLSVTVVHVKCEWDTTRILSLLHFFILIKTGLSQHSCGLTFLLCCDGSGYSGHFLIRTENRVENMTLRTWAKLWASH